MEPARLGAVLLAIANGACGQSGNQLWSEFSMLVRRSLSRRHAGGEAVALARSGEAALAAFEEAPADHRRAVALAHAMIARAMVDAGFRRRLEGWWEHASQLRIGGGQAINTVSGGVQLGPVLQGRDFGDITINLTVRSAGIADVALGQLPAVVAGFAGREAELTTLADLLDPARAAKTVVVSAVAGLAGVGKTALAVQAGHAARDQGWFHGGVLFIDLHGYDEMPVEPGQALDALLRAVGITAERIPPDAEARASLYRSKLAEVSEPLLLIADNASSEAQVRPLLPGVRRHKVVVTSRHTLAGLDARLVDVTALSEAESAALLDAALRTARPEDDRIANDPDGALRLAVVCGGLPLALQIAAALLKADPRLSVGQLVDELTAEPMRLERLRYDDGGGMSSPSVIRAFELSCRQLKVTAGRVFRLLSLGPGPDVSTAAAAVLADLPANQARDILASLARAHLIEPAPAGRARWRMHDLLRLYAKGLSEAHADADGREGARDRLLGYYMRLTSAANDRLRELPGQAVPEEFADRLGALEWLDAERASLVAAVQMASDSGRDDVASRLPLVLATYFSWRLHFDDRLVTSAIGLEAARRLGDRNGEAQAMNNLANSLRQVRRFDDAIAAHQSAAAVYRETGDQLGEGKALNNLGLVLREKRQFDDAIAAHQSAAAIYRETGDRYSEGKVLTNLGLALVEARQFEQAIAVCQEAAAIYRETGDRYGEGKVLNNLGLALQHTKRFEEAIAAHREDLAICRESGDRNSEGLALNNLGMALQGMQHHEEAIRAFREAAIISRETDDRYSEGRMLNNLGYSLREAGSFEEAITICLEAAAIFQELADQHGRGLPLDNLGLALQKLRRFQEAIAAHQDAIAIFRETRDHHAESDAQDHLGTAQLALAAQRQRNVE